ncbi:MAG: type IX secretion system membrane protein PorP/SprF [Brumimicrobium sp.]
MSKPTFENIDRWFFEYTEGNLSPAQLEQFEQFVSEYPELKNELELWQEARVSKEVSNFNSAQFLKEAPFYSTPIALTIISFIVLIGGYFIFDNFTTIALYSQSKSDLEIISIEDDDFFDRKASNNYLAKNRSSKTQSNLSESKSAHDFNTVKTPNTNETLSNKEEVKNSNPPIASKSDNDNIQYFNNENNKNGGSHLNTKINQELRVNNVQADDLPEVVAYLNRNNDKTDRLGDPVATSGHDISHTQSSFKRKMELLLRKIKRMADQPIALRNTKDQYFHTPMMTGFNANFGMVGSVPGNRIQTTSRNQWMGEDNQQLMNTVSWDGYVYALRGGLGVDVSYNNYSKNSIENFQVALTYSPKLSLNKNISIEPAIRFKMGAINVDTEAPIIGSNIEINRNQVLPLFQESSPPTGSQLWYRDVGAGLLVNSKWFYAGVNVDNIGRHFNNFYSSELNNNYRENVYLTSVIGTEYQSITKDLRTAGYVLHQKYGELNELWAGCNLQWKWIQAGAAVNTNLGVGASAGVKFDKFSFHYNIDNTYSRLSNKKLMSHQVTMRIVLKPSRYAAKFLNM